MDFVYHVSWVWRIVQRFSTSFRGAIRCHRILRIISVLWLPATIFEKLGIQGSLLQDLARKGFCWNRIVKISYLTFFCWWWFLIVFGVFFSWRYSSNGTKDQLCEEVCLLLAKGFRSQRLAVRKELTKMLNRRGGRMIWFAELDIQFMYLCCIIYTHIIYYTYIHISYAKGPWKGFALGGLRGMQWAVSAKVFSEMA